MVSLQTVSQKWQGVLFAAMGVILFVVLLAQWGVFTHLMVSAGLSSTQAQSVITAITNGTVDSLPPIPALTKAVLNTAISLFNVFGTQSALAY